MQWCGTDWPLGGQNFGGPQKKLSIGGQLQTFLHAMTYCTIIVLIIILLHSVSVITNFLIPKRDKQTNRQRTWHFFVYSRRATHDPHHAWHGHRGGPYHFCTDWPPNRLTTTQTSQWCHCSHFLRSDFLTHKNSTFCLAHISKIIKHFAPCFLLNQEYLTK